MTEEPSNSQASFTKLFFAGEDDVIDALLSVLRRDRWENLKMHYENGSLSAERTELRFYEKEEHPVTFAISATWFGSETEKEVEIMVEISEYEFDWTQDECTTLCQSILEALRNIFPMGISGQNAINN